MCRALLFWQGVDLFALNFIWTRSSSIKHSWCQKTIDTGLTEGEGRIPLRSLVLTIPEGQTDRQTDMTQHILPLAKLALRRAVKIVCRQRTWVSDNSWLTHIFAAYLSNRSIDRWRCHLELVIWCCKHAAHGRHSEHHIWNLVQLIKTFCDAVKQYVV